MRFIFWLIIFALGWVLGDRYGLPAPVAGAVDGALGAIERAVGLDTDAEEPDAAAPGTAAKASENDGAATAKKPEARSETAGQVGTSKPAATVSSNGAWDPARAASALEVCGGMTVSNAPRVDSQRRIVGFPGSVSVNGVAIATTPVADGCFSSGFGMRRGKMHRGIDFFSPTTVPIYAAAAGTVVEASYRGDFGNVVVIDHGKGAYTRYAHLAGFAGGVKTGATVAQGAKLGMMGNTADYKVVMHLHFEILTGDYDTPKRSFGLTAVDPLSLPSAD